jgi:hypothetical protein
MMGILPFLVEWLAISSDYAYVQRSQRYYGLLGDSFQQLPEEEIESFLPQICNILFDCQSSSDPRDLPAQQGKVKKAKVSEAQQSTLSAAHQLLQSLIEARQESPQLQTKHGSEAIAVKHRVARHINAQQSTKSNARCHNPSHSHRRFCSQ